MREARAAFTRATLFIAFGMPLSLGLLPAQAIVAPAVPLKGQGQSGIGLMVTSEPSYPQALRVQWVVPGGPAAIAGLQIGDAVLRVDGRDVEAQTLTTYISAKSPGTAVSLEFQRGAESKRAVVITIDQLTVAALEMLDAQHRSANNPNPKASSALSDLAEANPPAPKMRGGTATLECTGELVELTSYGFMIRLQRYPGIHPGGLGIASDRIVWVEDKTNAKPTLVADKAILSEELKKGGRILPERLKINAAGKSYEFAGDQSGPDYCLRFAYVAIQDFAGAEAQFVQLTRDLPVMRVAESLVALSEFQPKAAAWRAAGSKVDPPEEAHRHFVLAQGAFEEKNFQHQAEELSAALEIYPTWPSVQSDLAVLLGELGRYSEAIEHMRMYLELVPDAPDAQKAKQQIWIWQDKLAHVQPSQ